MKDVYRQSLLPFLRRSGRVPANQAGLERRKFLKLAGAAGVGVAAISLAGIGMAGSAADAASTSALDPPDPSAADSVVQIFTAALIAEDLATTFYYNGLTGMVIQDSNLAGPGGSATSIASSGNLANVGYLRGALSEEISHANLFRSLLSIPGAASDPVQSFYFPTGTFDTLEDFLPILLALETAFVGAYLAAIHEFAMMAARISPYASEQLNPSGTPYASQQLAYFAEAASSILGVEAEHRALARAIPAISPGVTTFAGINVFPADNVCFEQTDGIQTVYNGSNSAVAALTPFLQNGSGKTAYSFAAALKGSSVVSVPCSGGLPSA